MIVRRLRLILSNYAIMSTMKERLIEIWKEHETKIVILVGLILVALISFQGGYLKGKTLKENPLIIEKTASCPEASVATQPNEPRAETVANNLPTSTNPGSIENKNCVLVGSKNSNKYHLPSCRYAKTIKPENLVCFASKEDAGKRGYQPDTNCIK